MMRILVSAANSDISIAITRIIRLVYPEFVLIGVAPDGLRPGKNFYKTIEKIPFASDKENYISELYNIFNKHDVDLFIPISEKELSLLASLDSFNGNKNILINSKTIVETFLDKFKTYIWLKNIGVRVPETYLIDENISCNGPYIVKLRESAGSKNMFNVKSPAFLDAIREEYADQIDQYIIQRQISDGNQEYTCALWRHKDDFRFLILHRKLQGGLTGEAEVVENVHIEDVLHKIQKNISGDFFINVQLRLENGLPYIFEINPRFSSTVMMRHKIGFQDLIWSIAVKLNLPVSSGSKINAGIRIYRLARELVVENNTEE